MKDQRVERSWKKGWAKERSVGLAAFSGRRWLMTAMAWKRICYGHVALEAIRSMPMEGGRTAALRMCCLMVAETVIDFEIIDGLVVE